MTARNASCTAVIVAYNNAATIRACLVSLFEYSTVSLQVVVVDNSPGTNQGDETASAVKVFAAENPEKSVRLIRRPDNIGFAAGCNLGAKNAQSEYLLFFNPDARCDNDLPGILTNFLRQRGDVRVAGPQICDSQGRIVATCRNLATPFRIFCDATGLDRLLGVYRLLHFRHDRPRSVDQVIGACMAMRRTDFESMDGFDERFFIYFEEVDLCKRVLDAGAAVWFYPSARAVHIGGVSLESASMLDRMPLLLRRSRAQYFAKHYGIVPQFLVHAITIAESLGKGLVLFALSFVQPARSTERRARARGFFAVLKEWGV